MYRYFRLTSIVGIYNLHRIVNVNMFMTLVMILYTCRIRIGVLWNEIYGVVFKASFIHYSLDLYKNRN